jgi:two-component system sensor histidine kinase MtrB
MNKDAPGLRGILTSVTVTVVAVAVAISVSLVVLGRRLHENHRSLAATVESVRLAHEAEIELLLHSRTSDVLVQREIEGNLNGMLAELESHVARDGEAAALRRVSARAERYFQLARDRGASPATSASALDAAYESLDGLVASNVAHVREAGKRAARWDTIASLVGIGAACLLLMLAAVFVWWLRLRAFKPLFGLLRSMEMFPRGDRSARVQESGPSELRQAARRFNEMADALTTQRERQMTLLGGIAHDLGNPLATLRLSLAALRRKPPNPERVEHLFGVANRQIDRMERMLTDFMDTTRVDAGKLELKPQLCDLRALVRDCVAGFQNGAGRHDLRLTLPDTELWSHCDPHRIEQVLGNLVGNALKFSPKGGVIRVDVQRDSSADIISVSDEGVGINGADLSRLFEPFQRLDATKDQIPGNGLGLFIARHIVRLHAGEIDVFSQPNRGSTFRVRLPRPRKGTQALHEMGALEG